MAGKAPRPNRNSNGSPKQPSLNPTGDAAGAQAPQGPPSLVPPGGPPSVDQMQQMQQMAQQQQMQQQQQQGDQQAQQQAAQQAMQQAAQQHAQAMQLQQMKGQQQVQAAQARGAGPAQSSPAPAPQQGAPQPQAAPGADQGITPSQWQNNQVRESMNFKDLPPMAQAQVQEQEGINPAAPLQMIQSQLQSSLAEPGGPQGGPQQGPVPASFNGPMVPPGLEGLPHDLAALTQTMQRGFVPGADNAEHQMALNAHSLVTAKVQQAQNEAARAQQSNAAHQLVAGVLQHLSMAGQLPHPASVADHTMRHGAPGSPQLISSY